MADYPTSLDTLTNPTGSDFLSSPDHALQHSNANDIIEALEAKVGVTSSAVTTSHDYKLSLVTGTEKAISNATIIDEDNMASDSATRLPTQQSVKAYVDTNQGIITTTKYAPQGFLINGKIVPSVASDNLTVAIKGMDGNDPSASNPVYCRIGDTVRTVTAALSVTKNAGTNWCNAGGAELATKEIDYFVYLGYNATDGVVIGFSRIPYVQQYDGFSATSTNEKYCAISTISNAAAGDDYELVGRFAATLSAGAGYTWTVPTFTTVNLIQRPIYETRTLTHVPTITFTASGNPTTVSASLHSYRVIGNSVSLGVYVSYSGAGTAVTSVIYTTPFTSASSKVIGNSYSYPAVAQNGSFVHTDGKFYTYMATSSLTEAGGSALYPL